MGAIKMKVYNTNSSEFGRQHFYSEVEASDIGKRNKRAQTDEKKLALKKRRQCEDVHLAKELGITVSELNQNRLQS